MSELAYDIFFAIVPFFLTLTFFIVTPHALSLGLWKLGLGRFNIKYKDLRQGIQLILVAIYLCFLVVRVTIWSWQWH
jgi:hypothetical protein